MKKNYLKKNFQYWQKGYYAPNVEPAVFRFYGKFIKKKFKKSLNLLDFGCGQGSAVNFFNQQRLNAYGVDISKKDIKTAKKKYKKIKNKFFFTKDLNDLKNKFQKKFDIITCIQSLYYLSDYDFKLYINYFDQILKKNGIIYATMISTKSSFYSNKPNKEGLSLVDKDNFKKIEKHYINFTKSYDHLHKKFRKFKILNSGYYSFCLDKKNDVNHHYLVICKKIK